MPATPSTSDVTFVQPRSSSARSTAAVARCDCSLGRELGLDFGIQLCLGNSFLRYQWGITVYVQSALCQQGFCLGKFSLGAVESRLERPWVNLEQHLTLMNYRTFLIVLADDIARNLGMYLSIHISIEGCHPLVVDRHVALDWLRHLHFGDDLRNCSVAHLASTHSHAHDRKQNNQEGDVIRPPKKKIAVLKFAVK